MNPEVLEPGAVDLPPTPTERTPFPVDLFPGPIPEFIRLASKEARGEESTVALPLLSALGGLIGASSAISPAEGTHEQLPVIWTAVVGDSGISKTPGKSKVEAVIAPINKRLVHESMCRISEWEAEKGKKGPRPQERLLQVKDITPEKLNDVLSDNPRGLVSLQGELLQAIDFRKYRTSSSSSKGGFLDLHTSETISVHRKNGTRLYVERPCFSLYGGITPAELRSISGKEGHLYDGLLARFLLSCPTKRWFEMEDVPGLRASLAQMQELAEYLYDLPFQLDEYGHPVPKVYRLDADAKGMLREYERTIHKDRHAALEGPLLSAVNKLFPLYLLRIALVLHLVRQRYDETTPETVDAESISRAIRMVDWFFLQAEHAYKGYFGLNVNDAGIDLVTYLRSKGGRCKRTVLLYEGPGRFRKNGTNLDEAVRQGVDVGLLDIEPRKASNGKVEIWYVAKEKVVPSSLEVEEGVQDLGELPYNPVDGPIRPVDASSPPSPAAGPGEESSRFLAGSTRS
jgi:hypothetical protein